MAALCFRYQKQVLPRYFFIHARGNKTEKSLCSKTRRKNNGLEKARNMKDEFLLAWSIVYGTSATSFRSADHAENCRNDVIRFPALSFTGTAACINVGGSGARGEGRERGQRKEIKNGTNKTWNTAQNWWTMVGKQSERVCCIKDLTHEPGHRNLTPQWLIGIWRWLRQKIAADQQ